MIAKLRYAWNFAAIAALLMMTRAVLAQQFPYVAYVAQPDVTIRSGPGQQYYPTEKIESGYAVTVFRHDDGGWCAIRPPESSFSWVLAHQVRNENGRFAEIGAQQSVARVGSSLSPSRSAVQVLLAHGETVQLRPAEQE